MNKCAVLIKGEVRVNEGEGESESDGDGELYRRVF